MSIEAEKIEINGLEIDIVRKDIKNLHLGVYPPEGRVRIAAPSSMSDDAIRMAVITRLAWIKKQKAIFENQVRETKREYVDGESHYFFGERYRLNVVKHEGHNNVLVRNKSFIDLYVRNAYDISEREKALDHWYRDELKDVIPPILEKFSKALGLDIPQWGIKVMKTKWGSCNPVDRKIWLNLELAKKPLHCLEYVILHELVHLKFQSHDNHFFETMDTLMPKWKLFKSELNSVLKSLE